MTVLLELLAWPATYIISLGFHGASREQFAFAVMLTRFTFPYLMLISLAAVPLALILRNGKPGAGPPMAH